MGIESMIQAMTWNGGTGLGTVKTQVWTVEGSPAGTWVSSRNLTYVKLFNASHMAPYDVPHLAHDMILRFMGMNFSAIVDGSAKIPSSIGDNDTKPIFTTEADPTATTTPGSGKTPQQNKAMWEAYYNAGSAALVLILIFLAIGTFLWCRIRRNRLRLPAGNREHGDEEIPLRSAMATQEDEEDTPRKRKGKERALDEPEGPPIFDVGDSDDEEGYKSADERRG
jgi:carboxypeptidase D